jgi:UPF0271 protein
VRVDLNADLGEGFGAWTLTDDDALLGVVTSANVACGFHAGDPSTMRHACEEAARRGVAVGAHPGYRDLAGFGRNTIDVEPPRLADEVLYQVGALDAVARAAGTRVAYVKPHGALYNRIVSDEAQARAVAEGIRALAVGLPVLGLPGSVWLRVAEEAGLRPVREAFADRAYTPQGTLVSRRQPGAVVHDPAAVAERCVRLATRGEVLDVHGDAVAVQADSICVHGDTAGAVAIARRVREALEEAGVELRPFAAGAATAA